MTLNLSNISNALIDFFIYIIYSSLLKTSEFLEQILFFVFFFMLIAFCFVFLCFHRVMFACSVCKFRSFYKADMEVHLESRFHKEHFKFLSSQLSKPTTDFLQVTEPLFHI